MADSYVTSAAMRREARQGLAWRREFNRGGTAIGVARARTLAAGQRIPLDTVKRMHSFFSRHRVDLDAPSNSNPNDLGYPGAGLIAWKLWGGHAAASWARRIVEDADQEGLTGDVDSTGMDAVTAGSRLKYTNAARAQAAKSGTAMPSGKYPIRNRAELRAAIRRRHQSTEPSGAVNAHIRERASKLGVKLNVRLSTGQVLDTSLSTTEFAGRMGRSNSLKWPWLYDILRSKGYDKSKAAAISNSRVGTRKGGRWNVLGPKAAHNMKTVRAHMHAADKR